MEIRGLIDKLNPLLECLRTAPEAERRLASDAAHGIRTPLVGLRIHAQVALCSEDPKAHAHGLLQVSYSVERIDALMKQVLLLIHLDDDALPKQFHSVSLVTLAEGVLSELARQVIDKNIELSLYQGAVHMMDIDLWLRAMVGNLVGNILCYAPAEGQVEIHVENHAQYAVLWMHGNSPEIVLEGQQAISIRFYHSPAISSGEGNGLGLLVVKRIIELYFGSIDLGKGLEDKGLEVQMSLPKTQPDAARPSIGGPNSRQSHIQQPTHWSEKGQANSFAASQGTRMDISEAAKKSGLTPKMIRYYESIELFRLIGRDVSGYRHYNGNGLHILTLIRRSQGLGFPFGEIGKLLTLRQDRQRASVDVRALTAQHVCELDHRIEELSTLRNTLQDLIEHCQGDHRPDCPILKDLTPSRYH